MKEVLFFEDIVVGTSYRYGEYHVTREEIIEFATKWDPQPFHLDDEAGAASIFGELTGCAAHSFAIQSVLTNHHNPTPFALQAGLGTEYLRFVNPLRVDDIVSARMRFVDKRRSKSRPGSGIVTTEQALVNQRDEVVTESRGSALIRCREPGA